MYVSVESWVAMIVELPRPTIVTVLLFEIVATPELELVYVKLPVLFDVGGVIVKEPSVDTFGGISKLNVGTAFVTLKVVSIVAEA